MGPEELRRQALLEDRHFWYTARRRQVEQRVPRARAGGWGLDLGAGSGGNTRLLLEAGYQAVALEYHPVAAGFARARGLNVVVADGHVLPFPDGAFDLVMACDVLEHLADDGAAARELRRVLRPEGTLIVTVPADPALWSPHDVAVHHHRRYTAAQLRSLLHDNDLTVESLGSWMVLLRPLVALRRALTRRRAPLGPADGEAVSDLEEVPRILNAAFGVILRLEEKLPQLARRRRGVSLIAVASRPPD